MASDSRPKPSTPAVAALACLLPACAAVDAAPDYQRAAEEIRAATGVREVYRPGDDERRDRRVLELLRGELELYEAVEVALLNNPALRAAFCSIGMAKADRVQAALLGNPSLAMALRFPTSGGSPLIEGDLLGSLLDVWQRPAAIQTAEAALQLQVLEVAQSAVSLAAAVRAAYIDAVAAERLLAIAQENQATAGEMLHVAEERVAARAATAIDASLARLDVAATELGLRDAQLGVLEARRALATLLGIEASAAEYALGSEFAMEGELPAVEWLNELAEKSRLDLRAARQAVALASAELGRQRKRVFRTLDIGAAAEKEGEWSVGPAMQLELPLFDQNQAQVAKAAASLQQHEQVLGALRLDALAEVASARARAEASRDAARLFSEQIMVVSREALELTREAYRGGKTTIVPVLEAQRSLLRARREQVQRLQQAATAVSDLEHATGVPRESIFQPSARRGL